MSGSSVPINTLSEGLAGGLKSLPGAYDPQTGLAYPKSPPTTSGLQSTPAVNPLSSSLNNAIPTKPTTPATVVPQTTVPKAVPSVASATAVTQASGPPTVPAIVSYKPPVVPPPPSTTTTTVTLPSWLAALHNNFVAWGRRRML